MQICGTFNACPGCPIKPEDATKESTCRIMGEVAERLGPTLMLVDDMVEVELLKVLPNAEVNWDTVDNVLLAARRQGDNYCKGKYLDDYQGEKREQWQKFLNIAQM